MAAERRAGGGEVEKRDGGRRASAPLESASGEGNEDLSEGESAARGGDRAAEFFGGFEPFLDDDFYVGESFLVGFSVSGAAGKFGDFSDKRFVGLTPIDDDFVFRHRVLPPNGN